MKGIYQFLKTHILIFLFLGFYFTLAFSFYKDFGPTSDEWTERRAVENLGRYLPQPTSYESIVDSDYHDQFDFAPGHHPLVTKYQRSYQYVQFLLNPNGYYEWDHLINLLLGSLFFVLSYVLFYKVYSSSRIAIVQVAFLALTPRLVGDIPGNNKDMPFAVMYLASLVAIYLFSTKNYNTYIKIITLGTIFGLMQTSRSIGFSIYFVYLFYSVYLFIVDWEKINRKRIRDFVLELFIIGVFSLFVSVSIFPWLGSNFFSNIYDLLLNTKSFQYWDDTIFFNGEFLKKGDRPWHYLFTWILITTPVFILSLLALSLAYFKTLFKNKAFVILFIALGVNVILYLALQPTIYNGLRHFLFLLPIIVMISTITFIHLYRIIQKPIYKLLIIVILLLNSFSVIYNYITLHPYQYLYFNELIGGLHGASGKYEMDYWGATYKEATEWLVENRSLSQSNYVYGCNNDYSIEYYSQREFFISYGNSEVADYMICDIENEKKRTPRGEIIHEVKRQGVTLNVIRELNPTE